MEFLTLSQFLTLLHAFCEKHGAWGKVLACEDFKPQIRFSAVQSFSDNTVCIMICGITAQEFYDAAIKFHEAHSNATIHIKTLDEEFVCVEADEQFYIEDQFLIINKR